MSVPIQVVFDCADPARLAAFWAEALGYVTQDPPEGSASWEDFLESLGVPEDHWNDASAVVDPEGVRPRIYFQKVPEGKVVKNRVHLDINVGAGVEEDRSRARIEEEAERLIGLGASRVHEMEQRGEFWIVMQDPERNEFCLQ